MLFLPRAARGSLTGSGYTVFRLQVAVMDPGRFNRISLLLSSSQMMFTMMGVLELCVSRDFRGRLQVILSIQCMRFL